MTRNDLVRAFAGTPALRDAQTWASLAHELLSLFQIATRAVSDSQPLNQALAQQSRRIERYMLALSRLSFPRSTTHEQGWVHAVDGAHAIHKSLFETYVEFALCLTYAELFGPGPDEAGDNLPQRMYVYSDFVKRQKNYGRLHRIDEWTALVEECAHVGSPSPGITAFMAQDKVDVKQQLTEQARRIGGPGARFTQLGHWFPEKCSAGTYFVRRGEPEGLRPRNAGSMDWRCKAVLAQHFPDTGFRQWWEHSYDQYYDILNMFAHPSLGYDDSFRPGNERMLDLARMQVGIRINLHKVVLPPLRVLFRQAWEPLMQREQQLAELDRRITASTLPFLVEVDRIDYRELTE